MIKASTVPVVYFFLNINYLCILMAMVIAAVKIPTVHIYAYAL
jgi:hypothetical protein